MTKLLLLPALLITAGLLSGAYGAIHNQVSYTVAPEYFHAFKFDQFGIAETRRNRVGASLVGWRASWWMGLVIGVPIGLAGLFVKGAGAFARAFVIAAIMVVTTTFLIGLAALAVSFLTISAEDLPRWTHMRALDHPVAFARAGIMHNWAYVGALVGMLVGSGSMIRAVGHSRGLFGAVRSQP